ncbi:ADP-ribose pyrophosphatase YjhB (NUDIX family) [Arcanobacterium pluranimalium]|uniref:NUDIX hydrolase family protein n=1 Tax=Arcanobacterium pluranimalium TaxID=108028 RepID=UPI00195B42F5|nr:NUDIX hydrolase family protein [Arcanobacterium pluranimalium]MBM7825197.1 ADP-ribose pyrophosphatase YjhB (NUDIX family) [Arcanobacterium pluranimalium]
MNEIAPGDMEPWLSPEELEFVRHKVPMLYVDIVPVRTNDDGRIEAIGLILCMNDDVLSRSLVSGRVLYHESIRDALIRHIDKDLGLMALPQLPTSIVPFTVGEYFPTPGDTLYDPRQHAVSLAYVIPMNGDCTPQNDALEFSWFTPGEVATPELQAEMSESQARILRRALAHLTCF